MKTKNTVIGTSLLGATLLSTAAYAQEPAAASQPEPAPVVAAPAAPAVPAAASPVIKWEGLVDSYYLYNFSGSPATQGPALRAFDGSANSFTLNYAKVGLQADTDAFAFRLDVGYGLSGKIINTDNSALSVSDPRLDPAATARTAGSLYGSAFIVQQAFGTLKLSPNLWVDVGKFVTSASAEVIESSKNWLYSRSMLFNGVPFLHTGLRLNAKVSSALTLQGAVLNGWNNDPDNNSAKTLGLSILFAQDGNPLSAALNTYVGREAAGAGGDQRVLVDAIVGFVVSDKLSLSLNLDYLKEGTPYWLGASAMGKFVISPALYMAARGEFISSKDKGYAALDAKTLYEGTLMVGVPVSSNLEVRAEVRGDFADTAIFPQAKKNQFTGLGALLAYF